MSALSEMNDNQMVVYLQHDDPVVSMPNHISKYGLISAHAFLANSVVALLYNYNFLSAISCCLYITTLLFWNNLTHSGFIKMVDIAVVQIYALSITFYHSLWFSAWCREVWISIGCLSYLIYLINVSMFYCQTTPTQEITNDDPDNEPLIKYSYFSTKYITPNTYNRELVYYYSAFVHIMAMHFMIAFTCMYCIIYSDQTKTSVYPVLH
jgi:hypothetical protein